MYTTFYRELVDSSGCNIEFLDNENMNNLPQGYSQVVRNNTHNLGQQMFNSNLLMMVKNFSDNHENKNQENDSYNNRPAKLKSYEKFLSERYHDDPIGSNQNINLIQLSNVKNVKSQYMSDFHIDNKFQNTHAKNGIVDFNSDINIPRKGSEIYDKRNSQIHNMDGSSLSGYDRSIGFTKPNQKSSMPIIPVQENISLYSQDRLTMQERIPFHNTTSILSVPALPIQNKSFQKQGTLSQKLPIIDEGIFRNEDRSVIMNENQEYFTKKVKEDFYSEVKDKFTIMRIRSQYFKSNIGLVEILIHKFDNFKVENKEYMNKFLQQLKSTRAFYDGVTKNFHQKVPAYNHSRIQHFVHDSDIFDYNKHIRLQPFFITAREYMGPSFISHILTEMIEFESSFEFKDEMAFRNKRGSLLSFMWGARLAKFIKEVEATSIIFALDEQVYEIKKHGKVKDITMEDYLRFERNKYNKILQEISAEFIDYSQIQLEQREIKKILSGILRNKSYLYLRNPEHLRYLPEFTTLKNLRIFHKQPNLYKEEYHKDVYSMKYDWEINQQKEINNLPQIKQDKGQNETSTNKNEPMLYYDYGLVDCPAIICGKYRLIAEVFEVLDNEALEFLKLSNFETKIGEQQITSLKNGLENYYTLENKDELLLKGLTDEYKKQIEIRKKKIDNKNPNLNEIFHACDIEMPYDYINIEQFFLYLDYIHKLMKQYQYYVQKEISQSFFKVSKENSFISIKQQIEQKIMDYILKIKGLKFETANTGTIGTFESDPVEFIPRSRYYKPLYTEKFEYNLKNEDYMIDFNANIDEAFNNFMDDFRTSGVRGNLDSYIQTSHRGRSLFDNYPELSFLQKDKLDPLQKTWLEKRPLMMSALRPVNPPKKGIYAPTMDFFIKEKKNGMFD